MRRATFRMTLELSTTRQVFIVPLLIFAVCVRNCSDHAASCGDRFADVEHAVDVEHDQQLAVEPVDAGGDPRQPRIEIDRIGLARRCRRA